MQVCQAVQHAHQKGIIHRDLKPSTSSSPSRRRLIPVIDSASRKRPKAASSATVYTEIHQFIGTPAYESEQAEMSGLGIDTRSDIYSLGVVLYELLTGKTPFDGEELLRRGLDEMRHHSRRNSASVDTVEHHAGRQRLLPPKVDPPNLEAGHSPPAAISIDRDGVPRKDRTRRYETANGWRWISNAICTMKRLSRPPSAGYRFQKFIRRNRIAFSAGSVVFAALIFGLGISLWQYAGKSRAEREQKRLRQEAEAKAGEARSAQAEAAQQRDLARQWLYDSLLREARSTRKARQLGFRREVFDRLNQALALGTTNVDHTILRREAAACLGDWVGLDPVDLAEPKPAFEGVLSPDGSVAAITRDDDRVSLRDMNRRAARAAQ
jgi:serine/threonine protein kinase